MRRLALAAAALTLTTAVPAAARENYALLVGASTYPALAERYWLKGPANDVRLVQTYLATAAPVPFPAGHVTVLADGVEGAAPPTLAAIRAALDDLAARVEPGDFVYLHFSGHGTQAPAADPAAELDGLDELFLPVDIGPWSDSVGAVENALVDDEIGRMLDALTARGADVWVVFDSCHSGTATRAAPAGDDEVRLRQLPPDALGVPETSDTATRALPDPRARPEPPVEAGPGQGSLVAFFAAQTVEQTPEKNLPKNAPDRVPQGVFTYTLFEALAEHPGATYAQIGQEVLRKYAVTGRARTTPLFEGDLDRVVFSGDPAPRLAQWPVTVADGAFALPAGTLHGIGTGTRLAVLAGAADPVEAALGFVEVATADTFTARALPAADAAPPADLPAGTVLRKVSSDLDFTLTVALPPEGSAPAAALAAGIGALTEAAGPRLRFVPAGAETADLRLAVIPDSPRPDAIWVLPPSGLAEDLAATPSVGTADKDPAALGATLADTLNRMAKAINLLKLGAAVGTGQAGVAVTLQTRSPDRPTLAALDTGGVPRLVPDDEVHIEAANTSDGPVDLNVLYIGSDWSIGHMFAGRLQPGDTLRQGLLRITDAAFGRDRLVVVMTPAKAQTAVENLGFLAQDAVDVVRGGPGGLAEALAEAGFGETTRAAVGLGAPAPAAAAPAILQVELQTVPAD
jgi:hypothetical protein